MSDDASKASGGVVSDPDGYLDKVQQEVDLVRMMNRPTALTWWLLALNIVLWITAKLHGLWLGEQGLASTYLNAEQLSFFTGMKVNEAIADGAWWRLVSSQFVHLDILHLLFNGYGIFVLGRFLERCYGIRRILLLYLASGTVGAWASMMLNPAPAGGASGAVYGLVGAAVVFGFKYRDRLPKRLSLALTVGLLPWIGLSLGIGFMETIPMDNAAHIGGLVTGAVIAASMTSNLRRRSSTWSDGAVWILTIGVAVALVWVLAGWSDEAVRCLGSVEAYAECYPELVQEIRQARE